jgi:hypothetical protein
MAEKAIYLAVALQASTLAVSIGLALFSPFIFLACIILYHLGGAVAALEAFLASVCRCKI